MVGGRKGGTGVREEAEKSFRDTSRLTGVKKFLHKHGDEKLLEG